MSVSFPMRRGWCPGLLRPMTTGDGLLVRLHPRAGTLSANQVKAIADGARRFGNGLLDISSRGNLQIRGVTDTTHAALVEYLSEAGLTEGVRLEAPFRLTLTSPLAGLDPAELIDAQALAEQIERTCATLAGLPAKTCIVVDGRGMLPLDQIEADLRLVALDDATLALALSTRDGPEWIGTLALSSAPQTILSLLTRFIAILADEADDVRRIRDLPLGLRSTLIDGLTLGAPALPAYRPPAPRAGMLATGETCAVLAALPYGRCDADTFDHAAIWSERFGRSVLRLSPWRGWAIPHVSPGDASRLLTEAGSAGLIVRVEDPRLAVAACPGAPACTKGSTPTQDHAGRVARAAEHLLATGLSVHVSGCLKGCAHPGGADLTLIGSDGIYGIVLEGTARDKPGTRLPITAIVERLARAETRTDLMSYFSKPQP